MLLSWLDGFVLHNPENSRLESRAVLKWTGSSADTL